MPLELIHTTIFLAFFAVSAMAGEILVRTRRTKKGIPVSRKQI